MSETITEFKGKAGTIYIEKGNDADDHPFEVWFENLSIIGTGNTEIEALQDAKRHVEDITRLVGSAIIRTLDPDVADAEARIDATVSTTAGTGD